MRLTKILKSIYNTSIFNVQLRNQISRNVFGSGMCTVSKQLENCNVGTIGHVDHGKTTLTAAITKYCSKTGNSNYVSYDTIDHAPAEKSRGITINIFHCNYKTKLRHYSHIDCPGHADFIKNMIMGATQMDGAIVVVAATDGEMPQTREHLLLCKQIGIKKMIVFVNKADIVDKDTVELVEIEMREVLDRYGYDGSNSPIIIGSALLALNGDQSEYGEPSIQRLLDALDNYMSVPVRDCESPVVLPIDNSLMIPGRGTVVTGSIVQGTIKKKDNVVIVGFGKYIKSTVGDVHIFHKSVEKASAGDNVGLLLKNVKLNDIRKGMILCPPKTIEASNHYEVEIYLMTDDEGGRNKPAISKDLYIMYSLTWNALMQLVLPENMELLLPGEHTTAEVLFKIPLVVLVGQAFTFKNEGNTELLGTGRILKVLQSVHLPKGRFVRPRKPTEDVRKSARASK